MQELVEGALAAHQRERPRDRAGEEARPERGERDDEERDLDAQALHLEREEVRDREPEDEARDDGDHGRHDRRQHVVPVGPVVEQLTVVRGRERLVEPGVRPRPEADEDDDHERRDQVEADPEQPRRRQRSCHPAAAATCLAPFPERRLGLRRLLLEDGLDLLDLVERQPGGVLSGLIRRRGAGHPPPPRRS